MLRRVGKVIGLAGAMRPIVPCTEQFGYRNKTIFNFSYKRWTPPSVLDVEDDGLGTVINR